MKNRSLTLRLAAVAALATLATGAFAQETQRVAVKTDGLPAFVARAIEEKAGQGVGALRQYVERTRMIHGLYIPDLVREEEAGVEQAKAMPADAAPIVAKREAPATKVAAAKSSKPQLAKNAKAAPVHVASAKQPAATKVSAASAAAPKRLALAGLKTKRA